MSLYDHLVKVFEHFILHSPDKAVERFEEISYLIKQGRDPNEFFQCNDIRNYQSLAEESKEYVEKTMEYFPAQEIDDEGNVAQPDPLATQVQDMMAESRIFKSVSVSLPGLESASESKRPTDCRNRSKSSLLPSHILPFVSSVKSTVPRRIIMWSSARVRSLLMRMKLLLTVVRTLSQIPFSNPLALVSMS